MKRSPVAVRPSKPRLPGLHSRPPPSTGIFTLTIGVKKTTDMNLPFTDFPMNGPGMSTVVNGAGKLEFGFTVPDNAAFFRLESQ